MLVVVSNLIRRTRRAHIGLLVRCSVGAWKERMKIGRHLIVDELLVQCHDDAAWNGYMDTSLVF
jgi:hypothetical protein